MKIEFQNEIDKQYIEILPTLCVSWYSDTELWFGWLFWRIVIRF